MNRLIAMLLLLGVTAPAHADVVVPRGRIRPVPTAQITSIRRVSTDAPAADAEAVLREARAGLFGQQGRIRRCLTGVDTREDSFRTRRRTLTGRLVFSRSGRPTVHIDTVRGIPGPARACIEEGVRSIAVRTAPRGSVEIRFTFTLR